MRLYDSETGGLVRQFTSSCSDVRAVAFSADGKLLAAGGRDGQVRIWNSDDASVAREWNAQSMRLRSLAFSFNSDRLATAGEDRKVHIWNMATGQEIVALDAGDCKVMSLCFCAADRLATGGSDNLVHVWDLSNGKELTHYSGHLGTVAALACDPSGKLLVSGGFDASVRVWQLEGPAQGQAMRQSEAVQSREGTGNSGALGNREVAVVSILRSFARFGRSLLRGRPLAPRTDRHCAASKQHTSRFEQLEERKPLTANPFPDIHLGAVYLEPASGNDASPNVIQVTFQGGAPGTQLTQIVINGDKDHNGQYSSGEIFYDTAPGGEGVFASAPFHIVQANGFTVKNVQVSDGGQQLVIDLQNFVAGDKLVFSIDVDEVQFVDSSTGEVDVNAVVEGDEFQRSILTGNFTAPHYHDATASPLFWDEFDGRFADATASSGTTLDLPPDSYEPPATVDQTDLTAGAVATLAQIPLPSTISGTVYHDKNLDNLLEASEQGIGGVTLTLLQWNGSAWVSTGKTTLTDSNGNYEFDALLPGKYRVAETQPAGWLSVGSQPGTVDGAGDGVSTDADTLSDIILLGGQDGVHYNFGECLPASISGKVWSDTNGDCLYQPQTDAPLAGVQIDLLDSHGAVIATTTTNQQGDYQFTGLVPGTYSVFEHQPAGYLEGMDSVGTVNGVTDGVHGGTDLLSQIALGSGAAGIDYDFCEILPASLGGKVWNDVNGDCVYQLQTDVPLAGVQIDLLDSEGNTVVATTTTDPQGNYKFENLTPGTYSVREHQPAGYLEGMDILGTVGGVTVGTHGGTDLSTHITLGPGAAGIEYDFCEELPASLSGRVWNDTNGDCVYQPQTDLPLAGVQIDLLDSQGQVVKTTTTDSQGNYKFENLTPGTYSVFEHQPPGYLEDMDILGTVGGVHRRNARGHRSALEHRPRPRHGGHRLQLLRSPAGEPRGQGLERYERRLRLRAAATTFRWPACKSICSIRRARWSPHHSPMQQGNYKFDDLDARHLQRVRTSAGRLPRRHGHARHRRRRDCRHARRHRSAHQYRPRLRGSRHRLRFLRRAPGEPRRQSVERHQRRLRVRARPTTFRFRVCKSTCSTSHGNVVATTLTDEPRQLQIR